MDIYYALQIECFDKGTLCTLDILFGQVSIFSKRLFYDLCHGPLQLRFLDYFKDPYPLYLSP